MTARVEPVIGDALDGAKYAQQSPPTIENPIVGVRVVEVLEIRERLR
jgi:hypothetical protein